MTTTNTTSTLTSLSSSLSSYNTFKVTNSVTDQRIPNPFMCNSILAIHLDILNVDGIIFKRRFASDIPMFEPTISVSEQTTDEHSAIYTLHMQSDESNKTSTITIEASYDEAVFVPTEPCKINDSNFIGNKCFEFLMNPEYVDPNRSKLDEGLYVIDPNRLGAMTKQQEYMFENFMRFELEKECYHDVLKTVGFLANGCGVFIGVYDLETGGFVELHEMDGEIAIGMLKQVACV